MTIRLLKLDRLRNSNVNFLEIRKLNKEIMLFHFTSKKNKIMNLVLCNGNANNLWRAIKVAKNLNQDTIPLNLTHGGLPIEVNNRANAFATFFKEKITTHVVRARVSPNVYNGSNKIMVLNRNFMLPKDIKECMHTLQSKKCEGFDQIPLCVITDARDMPCSIS